MKRKLRMRKFMEKRMRENRVRASKKVQREIVFEKYGKPKKQRETEVRKL